MKDFIIQAIGFLGTACFLLAFQCKKRGTILLSQIIGSLCFTLHLILLGAFSGAAIHFLAVTRAVVFFFRGDKKWASSVWWLPVFITLSVLTVAMTWEGWLSLLPMFGVIFTTFAQFCKTPKGVRLQTLPSCPCWFSYNVLAGSISGAVTEVFIAASIIIGFLRHDIRRPSDSKNNVN